MSARGGKAGSGIIQDQADDVAALRQTGPELYKRHPG
jgi:hypothetical protein